MIFTMFKLIYLYIYYWMALVVFFIAFHVFLKADPYHSKLFVVFAQLKAL